MFPYNLTLDNDASVYSQLCYLPVVFQLPLDVLRVMNLFNCLYRVALVGFLSFRHHLESQKYTLADIYTSN